ncbi:MAG: aldo/keto reductase [Lysobacterales bacterium]|nr:MAG: aldo/keto reductase [Xanthomonadales bacterium]
MKLSVGQYRSLGKTGLSVPPIVFGSSSLGNLFGVIPDLTKLEICSEWFEYLEPPIVVDAAGKYGAGLALETIGRALAEFGIAPEQVIISNKLAWKRTPLRTAEPTFEPGMWFNLKNDAVQRISYEGMLECWEEGCRLLGGRYKPQLVSVHDPDEYLAASKSAADRDHRFDDILGAYRALGELKAAGEVRGIGVGAKEWRVVQEIDAAVELDWVMLANCLTVYKHPPEVLAFVSSLAERGVGIINSAVFHAGFLVGGKYFDFRPVSPDNDSDKRLFTWRKCFVALSEAHGISPMHACVQFGLSPPGVAAVSLNTSRPDRIKANVQAASTPVPPHFWTALKEEGLIDNNYPYLG